MVALDSVVGGAVGAVPGRWLQIGQHRRVQRRLIGGDPGGRDLGGADGPLEEPVGGAGVPPCGDEDLDDLPELVDRAGGCSATDPRPSPTSRPPASGQPRRAALAGGLGQQRHEPLDPPVDREVVDLDAALGEEFLEVAGGQVDAEVLADRNDDDVGREA
jgi:hypothetical protein